MSPVNLVEDHGFISQKYYIHWYEAFRGNPNQSYESLCSRWTISYHCGDVRSNVILESCPRFSQSSNIKQRIVKV